MGPIARIVPSVETQNATLVPKTACKPIKLRRTFKGAARIVAKSPATSCRHQRKNQTCVRRRKFNLKLVSRTESVLAWIEKFRNDEERMRCTNRKSPIAQKRSVAE